MVNKTSMDLDDYEKEILDAYETGSLKPTGSQTDYKEIARNTLKKNSKNPAKNHPS